MEPGKKNGDATGTGNAAGDKKPDDGSSTDAHGKSPAAGEKQPQQAAKEKNDPEGRADGKMPASDNQGDSGAVPTKNQPNAQPAAKGKPPSDGKSPAGVNRQPDGKSTNQTGEGEEKSPSDADGHADPGARDQTKSGQPASGKQATEKQAADNQAKEKQAANDSMEDRSTASQPSSGTKPDKKPTPQKNSGDGTENQGGNSDPSPSGDQPADPKTGRRPAIRQIGPKADAKINRQRTAPGKIRCRPARSG